MGVTFLMRLCWSLDGKVVMICNLYKKLFYMVLVLECGFWGSNFDFVGYKGFVVVVRFSFVFFYDEKRDKVYIVIVCGL